MVVFSRSKYALVMPVVFVMSTVLVVSVALLVSVVLVASVVLIVSVVLVVPVVRYSMVRIHIFAWLGVKFGCSDKRSEIPRRAIIE